MSDVPSESTFSCAFKDFAESDLPSRVHEAVIKEGYADQIVGHVSPCNIHVVPCSGLKVLFRYLQDRLCVVHA